MAAGVWEVGGAVRDWERGVEAARLVGGFFERGVSSFFKRIPCFCLGFSRGRGWFGGGFGIRRGAMEGDRVG